MGVSRKQVAIAKLEGALMAYMRAHGERCKCSLCDRAIRALAFSLTTRKPVEKATPDSP